MPPDEWLISRVCEEFHCLPSDAQRELDQDTGLVWTILRLRALAAAKREMQSASDQNRDITKSMTPAIRHVMALEAAAAIAAMQRRQTSPP